MLRAVALCALGAHLLVGCAADTRDTPDGPPTTSAASSTTIAAANQEAIPRELLEGGSLLVFGTGADEVLELLGPDGRHRFESGLIYDVAVTSDGLLAIARSDLIELIDGRGDVVASAPCPRCGAVRHDADGGVWTVSTNEDAVDGVLRHFDRDLNELLATPIEHVSDGGPRFENVTALEVVYADADGVVVQNVADDGVVRGGPFNLARVGADGERRAVAKTELRVLDAVPKPGGALLALTTHGSGGACASEEQIDFLDLHTSEIVMHIDLTSAVLDERTRGARGVVAHRGQWVGDFYLAHVLLTDNSPEPNECGADRGWVIVNPADGDVRIVPSSAVAETLGLSADPAWVVSYDGTCHRLVVGTIDGAIVLSDHGDEYPLLDEGDLVAGGHPLPANCFTALDVAD